MTWEGHPRTSTPAWKALRAQLLPGICHVCHQPGANQLDHINSWAEETRAGRDPDRLDNLAPIHKTPCHAKKTAREGNAARWSTRSARPPERHPGLT